MKLSAVIGFTVSVVSFLLLAMLIVKQQQQRVVKEDLLSLCLANMIFFFVFPGITIVPVEAGYLVQVEQ